LGFGIAWLLDSTQGFHAIMNLFLIPMWVLSGAFFPASGAPLWLRAIMAVNPLTYGLSALRRLVQPSESAILPALRTSLLVTVVFAALMFLVSAALVALRPEPARRAAKAMRSAR